MANADNSAITGKFTGTIGKQLVFRQWAGKTVVAKFPKEKTGDPSPAQAETQSKFFVASRYAKSVTTDPDQGLAEAYAKTLKPRQNVYSRAMEDFMTPPFVERIDPRLYRGIAGDPIIIRALDDFRVAEVRVQIYDASNALLEEGTAVVERQGLDWTYTATQANSAVAGTKIKVTAIDVPRNEGTLEITL